MTPRQCVLTAIRRQRPDRTPADYKAEPDVHQYMMKHLGVDTQTDDRPLPFGRAQVHVA